MNGKSSIKKNETVKKEFKTHISISNGNIRNKNGIILLLLFSSLKIVVAYNVIIDMQHSVAVAAVAATATMQPIKAKSITKTADTAASRNVFIFMFIGDKWFESIAVARTMKYAIILQLLLNLFQLMLTLFENHLPMRRPQISDNLVKMSHI